MSARALWIVGLVLAGLIAAIVVIRFAFARLLRTGGAPADAIEKTATSKDGTVIAYEQTGSGPVIILVSGALVDRDGTRPLAKQLASSFTVVNYDRRGRGRSANNLPYSVEREIEDLEALVSAYGGPVLLFGSSSGSVLALDATSRLGARVRKLFMYEPPFIVDASRPPIPEALLNEVTAAVSTNDMNGAVTLFFGKAMGIPPVGVTLMRFLMPAWADMKALAHTAPYDLMILAGTQSGKPLPADRWAPGTSPTMVAVGSKSEPFFHVGAKALAGMLPGVQYRSLEGLDHSAVLMGPGAIADAMRQFFAAGQYTGAGGCGDGL